MKTSFQLTNKLSITVLLIIISVMSSKAQIVYTNLNPDSILNIVKSGDGERIPIDFNGDGVAEFKFRYDNSGSVFLHIYRGNNGSIPDVLLKDTVTNSGPVPRVNPLIKNDDINLSRNWGYHIWGPILGDHWRTNFLNLGDRYIGVRFIISGKKYYGWILVSYTNLKLTVKGYAYESTPKKAIKAGDKGNVGISTQQKENSITIYPNPAKKLISINLEQKAKIKSIKIFNLLGSEVKQIITPNNNLRNIDISELKSGIYFVKLITDDNKAISKKLIIE